jgi:hypothetical protein
VTGKARTLNLLAIVTLALASHGAAQVSMRRTTSDTLSPLKAKFRDYVLELQDTLNKVESIHVQIVRARASGMNSVVLSWGRQLSRSCRAGAGMAETTTQRISTMVTDDQRGERAMATFRDGLATLTENLRTCERDETQVMSAKPPDQKRIEEIAESASVAVTDFRQVRDGLLPLLGIDLLRGKRSATRGP